MLRACFPAPEVEDVSTIGGNSSHVCPRSNWNCSTFSIAFVRLPGRTLRFLSIFVKTCVPGVEERGLEEARSGGV